MKHRWSKGLALIMALLMALTLATTGFAAEDWEGYKAAVIAEIPTDTENYDAIVAEVNAVTTATAGNLQAGADMVAGILETSGLTTTVDVSDFITVDDTVAAGAEANQIVSETTAYDSRTINEGDVYGAPEGFLLTMTAGGVETSMVPGEYQDVVLTVTPDTGHIGSYQGRGNDPYRTALFVKDGAVVEELSVPVAITSGEYTGTGATGLVINSESPSFSSIMLVNSDYTLSDITINADSDSDGSGDANDFSGLGAVVSVFDKSIVTIEDSTINTAGVAKPALFVDSGSAVLVKNSTLYAAGGTLYDGYVNTADQTVMVAPPWVLGIGGNARTMNVMGENTLAAYVDSTVGAKAWGALSTDAGQNMSIIAINTTVNVEDTGYGSYIIGNAQEYFYGTIFNVATYASILTGGEATYSSYTGGEALDIAQVDGTVVFPGVVSDTVAAGEVVPTVVNSGAFGIMAHNQGAINLEKGTIFNTENTAFLLKVGGVTVNVDDSLLNTNNGVILQMMDNDDAAVGATFENGSGPNFNTTYSEPEGYPGIDYDPADLAVEEEAEMGAPPMEGGEGEGGEGAPPATEEGPKSCIANLTNGTYTGDFYNSTGVTSDASTLQVNLGVGAELTGIISATSAIHWYDGAQAATFTIETPEKLGQLQNQPYYNGANDVHVVLTGGAVWNITGDCYVTSIDVQDGAIQASSPVTVYYADTINVPADIENVTFQQIGETAQ